MLAGGAIDTISARQHLAASDMHKMCGDAPGGSDSDMYRNKETKLHRQTRN